MRHPWVEVGARKRAIRKVAAGLGLDDLADLPAAPCLSSRIETGIAIEAAALGLVDRVERMMSRAIRLRTVRCRIRHDGMVIELDAEGLARLQSPDGAALRSRVGRLSAAHGHGSDVRFEPYRMGSAFKHG